jgi:vesicle coat complex subunit
MKKLVCI